MIAPGDAITAKGKPVFALPAIAVEADDFLHEVPGPDDFAVRLDGVDPAPSVAK